MAKRVINRGTVPNDGTGDNLRLGGEKINDNFDEIYSAIGDGSTISGTIKIQDQTSTELTLNARGDVFRIFGGSGIDATLSGNDLQISTDGSVLTETGVNTFENKTINLSDNTITGTTAEFNTALSDDDFATLTNTVVLTNKDLTDASNTFPTIAIRDDSSTEDTISLGETLIVTGGTGITSTIASNQLTLDIDNTVATLTGSQELTNKTINASSNSISNITTSELSASANIANTQLANYQITFGADTLALGDTTSTITDLDLDGTSSISGTGTIDTTGSANKIRFNHAYANLSALESAIPAATYSGMYVYNTTTNTAYVADPGGWSEIVTENSSIGLLSNVDITTSPPLNNEVLTFDSGTGIFKPLPQKINATAEIDVTNNGTSNYLFNSHYSGANPTLYFRAGGTYALNLDISGHPFHLQTVSGAYSAGNPYTTGLTHIATDGTVSTGASALLKESGTLYIEIPSGTDTTIYYACQYHSGMAGSIILQDNTAGAGASAGFAIAMSVAL